MKTIVITAKVSDTMYEAMVEAINSPNISSYGNLCIEVNTEDSTAPDNCRIGLLSLLSLSVEQENKKKQYEQEK